MATLQERDCDMAENQLTVSYELLYLMEWLLENEPERIKALIVYALDHGLTQDMQTAMKAKTFNADEMHYNLVDFLALMETLLYEALSEQTMKKAMQQKLLPAIDHIDNKACDKETVAWSIEKATSKIDLNPGENPREILFKELLKCWKPAKDNSPN